MTTRVVRWAAATVASGALAVAAAGVSAGQAPAPANPRAGDPAALQQGSELYRQRCAECHGADGRGVAGRDLTRLWTAGNTDARVFGIIRAGVPNTIMPSSSAPDDEIWAIVTYLRSLAGPAAEAGVAGNLVAGEKTFQTMCSGCHRLGGRGGRLGPDLSGLGRSQSREQLAAAVRNASASIAAGYQGVTIVLKDGRKVRGIRKSEDAFSIQIMDVRERLQGYLKADVQEIVRESRSLMPDYGPDRLSEGDLNDLLGYMIAAAGPAGPAPGRGRGAGGRGFGQ